MFSVCEHPYDPILIYNKITISLSNQPPWFLYFLNFKTLISLFNIETAVSLNTHLLYTRAIYDTQRESESLFHLILLKP